MEGAPEAQGPGLLDLPDALLRRLALLLDPLDRSRFCLVSRRMVELGDDSPELWADLVVAAHMFDVWRVTQALPRRRHAVRRLVLAPVMRGRPSVQAAEMEMLLYDVLEALEGGTLEQATIVSLVPADGPRPEVAGEWFKLPALRRLRLDGWCRFDLECGHLGALTSLELGVGARPDLWYPHSGSLPSSLAHLCLEDDEDNGNRGGAAIPACVRRAGGGLRHLHLASHELAALPLAALGALSRLTSLWLVDHGDCVPLGCPVPADREMGGGGGSGSGSDSGSDSEGGGGGSARRRREEAAWAAGTAGPLLPELRELAVSRVLSLPPAFSALTVLTHLQLNGQLGGLEGRGDAAVPDLAWRLPALKVLGLQRMALGPAFEQHAAELSALEVLRLDLPAAAVPPGALAAAPALRRLELINLPAAMGVRPAEALLAAVLAPAQLEELVLHAGSLEQLRSGGGGGGWAHLLDALQQRRPSLRVGCTDGACTLRCWSCGSCLPSNLGPELLAVREQLRMAPRPRKSAAFDGGF